MLKIKNIRDYRSYYKNDVRDQPTRDENFIGNYYTENDGRVTKKKFGWFEIYHGDKEGYGKAEAGIENFLQSFLDMARDGQAVYEFLQNAVDAGSTHFTMVWGEEESDGNQYLLVANNGQMFSFNSVRSILNVGSSTKSADSQTIGKFGIGFKLAHRLVGKDNGLQELLHENSGPMLFSWKNYELKGLAEGEDIVPQNIDFQSVDGQEYSILDENPWFFKILITCFPCLPENQFINDFPRLVNGSISNAPPFSQKEVGVLSTWVKKLLPSLNETTYKEGSLFFIRLGKGKEADLADKNLREGVRFSLAILNKTADKKPDQTKVLGTVQLNNGEPITIPNLQYLTFGITKSEDLLDYIYIRFGVNSVDLLQREQLDKLEREADIEVLIGFQDYDKIEDSFEGAPNFYLYFPLSEEVHNFNYILHCNAFYKGSSRTFLHRGSKGEDGINERLLSVIVKRLFSQLQNHANSSSLTDNKLFLDLYAALLTSGESENNEREWIKGPYIDPITRELGNIIPIADEAQGKGYSIASSSERVYVRSTNIDIGSEWLSEPMKWFFWGTEYPQFRSKASEKLNLSCYDVFSLLQNPNIYEKLNIWLANDQHKIKMLLKELSAPAANELKTEAFIQNLIRLEILSFSDGSIISLQKLDEVQDDGYLILHNKLSDIRDLLLKCDFKVSELDFNDFNFIEQYQNWLNVKSQLRGHTAVTRLFSQYITEINAKALTPDEKLRIFTAFRDLNSDNRGDRIKELKLYCNKGGQVVHFKNLLLESTYRWLEPFTIDPNEYQQELRNYLLVKDQDIYSGIIYPFWIQLSAQIVNVDKEQILTKVDELFGLYKPSEGEKELLKNYELLFFKSDSVRCKNVFYRDDLKEIPEEEYDRVQSALFTYFGIQIPDRFFLNFAEHEVFKLNQSIPDLPTERTEIPVRNLKEILDFCFYTKYDFFDQLIIRFENGLYITEGKGEFEQFYSINKKLIAYVQNYLPGQFLLLPDSLSAYIALLDLRNDIFTSRLIENYIEGQLEHELDFVESVLTENTPAKNALFDLIKYIPLDTQWKNERQNRVYLGLISSVLSVDQEVLSAIHEKLVLENGDKSLQLADIEQANDSIKIKRDERDLTLSQAEILNLPDKQSVKLVKEFAKACLDRNLLLDSQATLVFKLSARGITDELLKKFMATVKDKVIGNAHQLAFLLLSGKFSSEAIREYSIIAASNIPQVLEGPYLLPSVNLDIYDSNYVLGESYNDFKELTELSATEAIHYGPDDDDIIISRYLFINGCNHTVLNTTGNTILLLEELLTGMKVTSTEFLDKEHNQQNWEKALKFDPAKIVLHELSLPEEQVPPAVSDWLKIGDRNSKFRLMMALGASGTRSRIARLRQWLLSPFSAEFNHQDLYQIPHELLLNSLRILCRQSFVLQPDTLFVIGINDERLQLITDIWGILIKESYKSFPVLAYKSSEELVFVDPDLTSVYYLDNAYYLPLKGQSELVDLFGEVNILWLDHQYGDNLISMFNEVEVTEELYYENEVEEHSESFYKKWSQVHKINLYKVPLLLAKVFASIGQHQQFIGTIKPNRQYFAKPEDDKVKVIYNQKLTLEQLKDQMEDESENSIVAIADLIKARDTALVGFYHMMSMAETSEGEQSMYKALQKALQEESSRNERLAYLEKMDASEDFSYEWFIAFLEYMQTYEQLASTTVQRSLNFQNITRYKIDDIFSEKYFMLNGAANLIPVNVDVFKNFNITLVFRNRRKENIKVEGVSARGQDLLIYCPAGIPADVVDILEQVVNVSISFSPVLDLIYQLYLAFSNQSIITPWENINEALPPIEFIYGPPGTGKTTTICNILQEDFKDNRNIRCLILTPTNKAADVIVKKILTSESDLRPLRLSAATDPELEELDNEVYQTSLSASDVNYYNVVASTIHRYPYFKVVSDEGPDLKLYQLNGHWDYVVIDEASMVSLPYLVFILMSFNKHGKLPRFVVAGDPMQIPPVLDLSDKDMEDTDIADMNVYTMLGIKSFKPEEQTLRPVDRISNLDTQYRSVEAIGKLFSKISYRDQLKHGRDFTKEPIKILPKEFAKILPNPISFISFPLNNSHAVYENRKLLFSAYHLYAGQLVAEIISYFDKCNTDQDWTIGIIAPYKAQALITNKLIRSKPISNRLNIVCNTVHSFQGDQCDLVIFVVNPNNSWYTGNAKSLLSKDYIYNVAISRARDYLWVLNPFQDLSNPHVDKMVEVNKQSGNTSEIFSNQDIEKMIFNKNKQIEEFSFVTGHDNINIYGHSEMKYFVRLNDFAIDVQVIEGQK